MDGKVRGLTVVVPSFCEEDWIGSTVLSARKFASDVLVVDDGSRDRTGEIAALGGAKVLTHPRNRGRNAAIQTGIAEFLLGTNEFVAVLDGDKCKDAATVVELVARAKSAGADLVAVISQNQIEWQATRVTRRAADAKAIEFFVLSKRAAEALWSTIQEDSFSFDREIDHAVAKLGLRVEYVRRESDIPAEPAVLAPTAITFLRRLFNLFVTRRPLITLGGPGVALTVIGTSLGVYAMATHAAGLGVFGVAAVLVWAGLQLLSVAVISHLVIFFGSR